MRTLSIQIRNEMMPSYPKIKIISLHFSPEVSYTERLSGVKIMKIRVIENLTLGHL